MSDDKPIVGRITQLTDKPDITGGDIEVMRRSIDAKRALVLEAALRGPDDIPLSRADIQRELADLRATLANVAAQRDYYAGLVDDARELMPQLITGCEAFHNDEWGGGYECGVNAEACGGNVYKPERIQHIPQCEVAKAREWLAKPAAWARDGADKEAK